MLFVPGDRPDRIAKAWASEADALILDLEDSVAAASKPAARAAVAQALCEPRARPVFVRINPIGAFVDDDLELISRRPPEGVVAPKTEGPDTLTWLEARLPRGVRILPIAVETPTALFSLSALGGARERLCGITWGAEDLAAALGASAPRDTAATSFIAPLELARSLTLYAAAAAAVPAIETVYAHYRDDAGLAAAAARARRDGFAGMLAIHPCQVGPINRAFTPTAEDLRRAEAIVEAFARTPHAGALSFEGRMIDAPHLRLALNTLAQAGWAGALNGG